MSTKNSLVYEQDRFHFWVECFDDKFAYLRQDDTEFEATQEGVMVAIPADVMDKIAAKWLKHRRNTNNNNEKWDVGDVI